MDGDRCFGPESRSLSVLRNTGAGLARAQSSLYFLSEPCLVRERYQELVADFPSRRLLAGDAERVADFDSRISSSRVLDACEFPLAWRRFVAYHTSQAFWTQIAHAFGGEICRRYPSLEHDLDRPLKEWRAVRRGDERGGEITLECEIVVRGTSAIRPFSKEVPRLSTGTPLWLGRLQLGPHGEGVVGSDAALRETSSPIKIGNEVGVAGLEEQPGQYTENSFIGFVLAPDSGQGPRELAPDGPSPRFVEFSARVNYPVYGLLSRGASNFEWFRFFQRQGYR